MVNQLKIYAVENLQAELAGAEVIALIDYQGLTANQFAELRAAIKEAGGQIQVVKNRLLLRALQGLGIVSDQPLTGQTAVVWGNKKQIEPLQIIKKFAKDWEKPTFRWGVYQKAVIDKASLERLANLPSQETLRAQVVAGLQAPLRGLVFSLQYWPQQLTLTLKALAEQKK